MLFSELAAFGTGMPDNRCQLPGDSALIPIYNENAEALIRP